jgi:hypothetical protein
MLTVIIHCWMKPSWPRRLRGPNSAIEQGVKRGVASSVVQRSPLR